MDKEKIRKIADYYGFAEQSRQLFEEMSELAVSINKYYRECNKNLVTPNDYLNMQHCISNIEEEIADVTIMLEQMKYLLSISDTDIEKIRNQKLVRQLERIRDGLE